MAETNKTAYAKGKADGRAGRMPRPDFTKVGLAGSYRLGYDVGEKERHAGRFMGPRKNVRRNGMFDAAAAKRAQKVTRIPKRKESPKARRTVVEASTGEKGYLVSTLPGGWLKVKWDHREKPTLIKRSELRRARNPKALPKEKLNVILRIIQVQDEKFKLTAQEKEQQFDYLARKSDIELARILRLHLEAVRQDAKLSRKNPGLLSLVSGMQALDYLGSKIKGKKNPSLSQCFKTEQALKRKLEANSRRCQEHRNPCSCNKRKSNPSPAEMSERFQGHATGAVREYYFSDSAPRLDFSRAGRFVFLKLNGKQLRIPSAVVAIDPVTEKLWIGSSKRGAMFNRRAKAKGEGLDYGKVDEICYDTAKQHIGEGKRFEYHHKFGEEGGRKPHLIVDHEGMPILRGGDYQIRVEGIVD